MMMIAQSDFHVKSCKRKQIVVALFSKRSDIIRDLLINSRDLFNIFRMDQFLILNYDA